jgi:hypothetical protein
VREDSLHILFKKEFDEELRELHVCPDEDLPLLINKQWLSARNEREYWERIRMVNRGERENE